MKKKNVVLAATIAVGLALVPALSAEAFSDSGTQYKSCVNPPVPYVQINSTGSGRVNHSLNGSTIASYNNGATSKSNGTPTSALAANWRVFLTGIGGNITYAGAVCHS